MNRIYIISEPIQTGKTTLLSQWVANQYDVAGILTPDIDHKRKLYDIKSGVYYPLQLNDDEAGVPIGRFVFDELIFNKAQQLLKDGRNSRWLIVDEVGRLEINHKKGLEPYLTDLIEYYKSEQASGNLLLVIRDYLLQIAIEHYQLQDAVVLPKQFFNNTNIEQQNDLVGIVLCGGQSVRMGRDKSLITYHNKPQYAHVADQLGAFCKEVYISCNQQQQSLFAASYQKLVDNATFGSIGPMSGILTAVEAFPQKSLLVIGCDYPNLTIADIVTLKENRTPSSFDAVCYQNSASGFDEPLLAIYEKQCGILLQQYHAREQHSLRHFLATIRTNRISPTDNNHIKSVDYQL